MFPKNLRHWECILCWTLVIELRYFHFEIFSVNTRAYMISVLDFMATILCLVFHFEDLNTKKKKRNELKESEKRKKGYDNVVLKNKDWTVCGVCLQCAVYIVHLFSLNFSNRMTYCNELSMKCNVNKMMVANTNNNTINTSLAQMPGLSSKRGRVQNILDMYSTL